MSSSWFDVVVAVVKSGSDAKKSAAKTNEESLELENVDDSSHWTGEYLLLFGRRELLEGSRFIVGEF